jgi:hypothetical protein
VVQEFRHVAFNLEQELSGVSPGTEDSWSVTRYGEDTQPGDVAILWQAGKNAGIYALGELERGPYLFVYDEGEAPPWVAGKNNRSDSLVEEERVHFRYTRVLREPLFKKALLEHPTLRNMQVIKAPMGTNFKVSATEWENLQELFGNEGVEELDRGPLNVMRWQPPASPARDHHGETFTGSAGHLLLRAPSLPLSGLERLAPLSAAITPLPCAVLTIRALRDAPPCACCASY